MFGRKKSQAGGGAFAFRVSDVVSVPLRGTMLRLRVRDGAPSMGDLATGSVVRLVSPTGQERRLRIVGHALTGGVASQERLERTRELDVIVADDETSVGDIEAEIGWTVTGPA